MDGRLLAGVRSIGVGALLATFATLVAGCGGGDANPGDLGDADDFDGTVDGGTTGGFDARIDTSGGTCKPTTCAAAGVNCGPVADGCGGLIKDCGSCKSPEICGGGGKPSVCGNSLAPDGGSPCKSRTCADVDANCGPVADGCGGLLACGSCSAPDSCGGGGTPSKCGVTWLTDGGSPGSCTPKSCGDLGIDCGPAGDGCGGTLDCGTCTGTDSCGGGGTPSVCGDPSKLPDGGSLCTPRTCADAGANCGPIGDGCGGIIPSCGACTPPQICGGGGVASVCGDSLAVDGSPCIPTSCAAVGANCGFIGDGCGGTIDCGTCTPPAICGGSGVPSVCGGFDAGADATPCTGLCTKRVACPGSGVTTTISGTVTAPGHTDTVTWGSPDPIYGAAVYIPNCSVAPFTAGVSCDKCGAAVSGCPLETVITGADGKFTLKDVPVGTSIPLVIQMGRWRRQVTIPTVTACVDNPQPNSLTHFPRNKGEGDIPLTAMDTGSADSLECVLRKIGIDDAEFTADTGTGRVQMFHANGPTVTGIRSETNLFASVASLSKYDLVFFDCEGVAYPTNSETAAVQKNVIDYTSAGGRVYATHYSYVWLFNDAPFSGTATWDINQANPPSPLTVNVDTSFPKGAIFSTWLDIVGASTAPGSNKIVLNVTRKDFDAVVAPSQEWLNYGAGKTPIHYTFNTPVGTAPDSQCGRVMYSDFHVSAGSGTGAFPGVCPNAPLTPQEKVLEFMLFDLASCITPDTTPPPPPPSCTPRTCAAASADCGPVADGCGGLLDCGTCAPPACCGCGGVSSKCGGPTCTPTTCTALGLACGPAGDGCGGLLDCGPCVPPATCGGGGSPGVCGAPPPCKKLSCSDEGISCGPAGDGCGGAIDCGSCTAPETCGGAGIPGKCGHADAGPCKPITCADQGLSCGPAGDGCGGALDCGECVAPMTCGGGGTPGKCGGPSCTKRTCASVGATCGPIADGCGGIVDCGTCTPPQTCGGGGTPSVCGGGAK